VICGPEFGIENVGKVALIHRALYGGKSAGRDFKNHLCWKCCRALIEGADIAKTVNAFVSFLQPIGLA
jgi:hypothetical protein